MGVDLIMIRMISSILKALASPAKRSSAELKADLAKLDMQGCEAKVTELERQRRQLLLRGSDEELRTSTQDLEAANLEAERTQAAIDELQRLIAEAEKREAGDALDARRALAVDAQADSLRCLVAIDHHAVELARLLGELDDHRRIISDSNKALAEAGRSSDRVPHAHVALAGHCGLHVPGFPQTQNWALSGYVGHVVEPRYRLHRASELLPSARAAKRAA